MSSAPSGEQTARRPRGRVASFFLDDHRYVLLGTSAVALVGMLLSSSPRPPMSFLAQAFTVELVMYYVLAAWLVVSAVALVFKLTHWKNYAETSPFARPAARRALRYASYVIWAMALVLVVDRLVMGFASAWAVATATPDRPADDFLQNIIWMFWVSRSTYATGIGTTIALAVFGTVIAFFLALLLVFCRIQAVDRPDNDFVRFWKVVGAGFAKVYSTVVRGTPMMVQAMIVYYGILGIIRATGDFSGAELNQIWSPFNAGLVTVSLNSTAYMMEVLRGGIAAVDKGQMEAARSLGLSQWQAMLKVVFPQGIKNSIPGLSNELVINIKDSSVLSIISVFDLTFAARTIGGNYYEYFPAFLIAAAIYLVLTMVATWLLGRFARRFNVKTEAVGSTSDTPVKVEG
ncbi:amino acid ABC transporter permease [Olsenella sp. SW781]|uniref:amino acid ABC transporter permease n=1 Tax=Olsenella sp. SW781 TaxID=2530046 RepID=UPI00143C7340|nr:amino acid ABC transporter permease [Olsenella sp. SW781]NJE81744.1 amino acid ABC transporter permease [Olsenella sp. SW781]